MLTCSLVHEIILLCLIKRELRYKSALGDQHWAFKMVTEIPQLFLLNSLLLTVLYRVLLLPEPLYVHSEVGKHLQNCPPSLSSYVYPKGLIHPLTCCSGTGLTLQTTILLHLLTPKEREHFGRANQVCGLHYVSWLPGRNGDIDVLLDLKTVVESQEWERVERLESKE